MRILLDEDVPRRLATLLVGHDVETVPRCGWAGTRNGQLLALAATRFDVLITMDRNLEYQQNMSAPPIEVLVIDAVSNRIEHVQPLVPDIHLALQTPQPKTLRHVRKRPSDS